MGPCTVLLSVMSLQIAFNVHAYTFDMCNNKVYLLTYFVSRLPTVTDGPCDAIFNAAVYTDHVKTMRNIPVQPLLYT